MAIIREFHGKRPQIHPEAFVAENAVLIGDVTVEKGCSVWYGAVLRGDWSSIRVGEGSNIQDNAVLHTERDAPLRIGKNVTVGHGALVHCAEVGDDTLIGMGAILLDGVRIGCGCVVGAGAVVKEHGEVPDGTMAVGVPAKVVKEVGPDMAGRLKSVSPYVALAEEYRA